MIKTTRIPEHCKNCSAHWKNGVKDGKHNNWCTKYGKPALKAMGHCINENGKVTKGENR